MGPILGHLGETAEVAVVAGGLLGLLPLHAAWTPDSSRVTGRRYVLDTVSVSYVPNARALAAARRLAAEVPLARLLAVAEPSAGGRCPAADGEVRGDDGSCGISGIARNAAGRGGDVPVIRAGGAESQRSASGMPRLRRAGQPS